MGQQLPRPWLSRRFCFFFLSHVRPNLRRLSEPIGLRPQEFMQNLRLSWFRLRNHHRSDARRFHRLRWRAHASYELDKFLKKVLYLGPARYQDSLRFLFKNGL